MFFIKGSYFPRRLLRRFVVKSVILFLVIYSGMFAFFRFFLMEDLRSYFPGFEWDPVLWIVFFLFVGSSLALFFGLLAFVFFELLIPMGVLFRRLKRIHTQEEESEEELTTEDTGEWSELETALASLRSELQKSKRHINQNVALLATLVDALPEGVLAVDRKLRPVFYNETMLTLVHLTGADLREKNLVEIIRDPEVTKAFEKSLTQRTRTRVEFSLPNESLTYQVTVAPIVDGEGDDLRGLVSVFQDITELKKLERMRIDFVANVSHELRTPLTSVKGYTQTLIEDIRARRFDQGERYLEVVNRNVDRLLELVGDLLDLSSLESGLRLKIADVPTQHLTAMVIDQIEPMRAKKGIQIETIFEAPFVHVDEARAQQVLLNLVQNAIQYIPEGGQIQVLWKPVAEGVELHVTDNGPGIGADHLSRLFERFYRVDKARNRESGGTGLGLAIVKHVVQRHGGLAKVDSTIGKGTQFICLFPNHNDVINS